ncbi:MAG: glycyl-radical enzyme activating protein [Halanaerobiales bacterium]|nr:glycyl-radical enzyme activating protein [Halanaerobiales bacterium]
MAEPLIFDIKRSSLDDGPGIRTVVFLKGCPLECIWCHNPESNNAKMEIAFDSNRCIGCQECQKICPNGVIDFYSGIFFDQIKCIGCGKCTEVCYSLARRKIGEKYTIDNLIDIIKRDKTFYESSGGGVTFSGGEPMLYMNYLSKVMQRLKEDKIHIAIETSGYFNLEQFKEKIMPFVNLVLYDIKLFDSNLHKKYTGKDNAQILNNFSNLYGISGIEIIPRVPLIPGITANLENLKEIANFLKKCGCADLRLLPYNTGGINKRIKLGKVIPSEISQSHLDYEEEEKLKRKALEFLL